MQDEVRVVVVDDMRDAADSLANLLHSSGYQVSVATSAVQALRMVADLPPHCVLFDVMMPDVDGAELARQLRLAHVDDIVLIAVTGGHDDDPRVRATFALVDHYLRKPVDPALLDRLLPPTQA